VWLRISAPWLASSPGRGAFENGWEQTVLMVDAAAPGYR
jgi:hypothetical protein